jgi:hypothetical protein
VSDVKTNLRHRGDDARIRPIRCDRAGRSNFHAVSDEPSQEGFRHLAAAGVVFANEQYERFQKLLHCDHVDEAAVELALLFESPDLATAEFGVQCTTCVVERKREEDQFR